MIQRKTWQRFGILFLAGILLSWLISCTPASQSGDTLDFWTMGLPRSKFGAYFDPLISEFEKDNPGVKVKWTDVAWDGMQSKIQAAVAAKTAPDVVNLNPDFAFQLAGRGSWMELNDVIDQADRDRYLSNIWDASSLDGKTFGVPWYLTARIAIYNKAVFDEAGVTTPPQTYAELADAAQKIKAKTGKYAFFITTNPTGSGELMESFVQMGVQLIDQEGKAAFNTPEGKAAFQYWVDLYQKGLIPPAVLTEGHKGAIDFYQSGNVALLSSSPQSIETVKTNAPDIAKVSVPAPPITGSTGKKNVAVMNLVIPKDTDKPDAALKFALFVTNPKNQLAFAKEANVLPSTQESLTDPYFSQAQDSDALATARVLSASQLKDTEILIPSRKDIKKLQQILYKNLREAMLKKTSVDQALAKAETAWNQTVGG
ncbi:sugar ABC transporter substrate-binding protein [Acaryochloris sp. IP29b_bin.148]|uniref:ABC transporter substrate-binding protein n=1 Tax=Acaryochloris sp. IP29b_bin.148 TaxID=2969218 RepID=UPI00261B1726|nr:sugar ABC transporter substrate-binding protein [Acaryochloris sp. IP29b_bin.148]